MTYEFHDAATQPFSQTLLLGLAGASGSGKTESAMLIARGFVGHEGKFCVIDTENRRALNKKNRHRFDHLDLQPPYSPETFESAIRAAIDRGYGAIIIDSFSAEWDGDGGLSDEAASILDRLSKGDAGAAERMTAIAWKAPKQKHKKLMGFLRKCDVPIIFCLRAEPKIKFVKRWDERRKREVTEVIDAGWLPIAEKMLGFDMLIYALMMADNPGVPVHLKKLEPEFEPLFPLGKQITQDVGARLAEWANGGTDTHHTLAQLVSLAKKQGISEERFRAEQEQRFGVRLFKNLTQAQIDTLYNHFSAPQSDATPSEPLSYPVEEERAARDQRDVDVYATQAEINDLYRYAFQVSPDARAAAEALVKTYGALLPVEQIEAFKAQHRQEAQA